MGLYFGKEGIKRQPLSYFGSLTHTHVLGKPVAPQHSRLHDSHWFLFEPTCPIQLPHAKKFIVVRKFYSNRPQEDNALALPNHEPATPALPRGASAVAPALSHQRAPGRTKVLAPGAAVYWPVAAPLLDAFLQSLQAKTGFERERARERWQPP
jgi:hypothetical protein